MIPGKGRLDVIGSALLIAVAVGLYHVESVVAADDADKTMPPTERELAELVPRYTILMNQQRYAEARAVARTYYRWVSERTFTAEEMIIDAEVAMEVQWKKNVSHEHRRQRIEALLDRKITVHRVVRLSAMVQLLSAATDVPIRLAPTGLDEAGIRADRPVALSVDDAPLRVALEKLLEPLKLDYEVRGDLAPEDVVWIANRRPIREEQRSCAACHQNTKIALGPIWLSDFAAARELAHDTKRPLLIVFDKKSIAPSRKLMAQVFQSPEGIATLHPAFVAVNVDYYGGRDFVERNADAAYAMSSIPTVLLVDGAGKVLHRSEGYSPDDRQKFRDELRRLAERHGKKRAE